MHDSISRIFLLDNADCNSPSRASRLRSPIALIFRATRRAVQHAIVVSLSLRAWLRRTREPIRGLAAISPSMFYDRLIIGLTLVTTKVVLRVWRNRIGDKCPRVVCPVVITLVFSVEDPVGLYCGLVRSFSAERARSFHRFRVIYRKDLNSPRKRFAPG